MAQIPTRLWQIQSSGSGTWGFGFEVVGTRVFFFFFFFVGTFLRSTCPRKCFKHSPVASARIGRARELQITEGNPRQFPECNPRHIQQTAGNNKGAYTALPVQPKHDTECTGFHLLQNSAGAHLAVKCSRRFYLPLTLTLWRSSARDGFTFPWP